MITTTMIDTIDYNKLEFTNFTSKNATIAVRKIGVGPPLLLVHGWPVFGYTWRHMLPTLSKHFTCYILDMPGLGDSSWNDNTNFHWRTQASRIIEFVNENEINSFSILANNSGGAISRIVALEVKSRLKNLMLINTEMPGHRPPWIPFYQKTLSLPFSGFVFSMLLKNRIFINSSMAFKGFYTDKSLIEKFIKPYVDPLIKTKARLQGATKYLIGCDMTVTDTFTKLHKQIEANVLLLWGEDDPTFPIDLARTMGKQFKDSKFSTIPKTSFMPHEEDPEFVTKEVLAFMKILS